MIGVLCVALTVLITLIAFVPGYVADPDATVGLPAASYSYDKIRSAEEAAAFLSQFSWQVEATPVEIRTVTVPEEFDKVFSAYNEMQKEQGLNLAKYKKKDVVRYTFSVTNYPDYEGTVYANVLVYRNRVVGGDISSAALDGFVHGFEKP